MKDPIVEEVREIRRQLDKQYGPGLKGWLKELHELEAQLKGRLVSRGPVRLSREDAQNLPDLRAAKCADERLTP